MQAKADVEYLNQFFNKRLLSQNEFNKLSDKSLLRYYRKRVLPF